MTLPAHSLSLVVPALNEAPGLTAGLEALGSWREVAEIVLVDGGSEDGTAELARPLVDLVIEAPRGRARQMNAGAARAGGEYLLFLHCDTRLSMAPSQFISLLEERPAWGFFRVRLSGADWRYRVVEWFMNRRSVLSSVATGDQALFVSRSLFERVGGFKEIPLMEDVEICKRLRRRARPRVVESPVTTSSRRWEKRGVLRTVLLMWYLRLRFWLGADPARLARLYESG